MPRPTSALPSRAKPKVYTADAVLGVEKQLKAFDEKRRRLDHTQDNGSSCVIDPRSSSRLGTWDMVTSVALIFTAIFTPIEVGFIPRRIAGLILCS